MVAYTGQKADKIATAQTLAQQLERFVEKPNKITEEFTTFKDNITSLGTAVLNMGETKLDIDYLVITSTDTEPEKTKRTSSLKCGMRSKHLRQLSTLTMMRLVMSMRRMMKK